METARKAPQVEGRQIIAPEPARLWIAYSQEDVKPPARRFFERGNELVNRLEHSSRDDRPELRREAIAAFEQAARLDEKMVDALVMRALVVATFGPPLEDEDLEAAIQACDRALSFEEEILYESKQIRNEIFSRGNTIEAVEEKQLWARARAADDYVAWLHIVRADVLMIAEDKVQNAKGKGLIFTWFGQLAERRRLSATTRYNEAIAECERALELRLCGDRANAGLDCDIYRTKARLLRRVGRIDEAISDFANALREMGEEATWNYNSSGNNSAADHIGRFVAISNELLAAVSDKRTEEGYNRNNMDVAEAIEAARAILNQVPPVERGIVVKALEENLTGEAAGDGSAGTHDPTTAKPRPESGPAQLPAAAAETTQRRPQWKPDLGLTAAEFAAQAYAPEIANRTFDKSLVRREDRTLYRLLFREKAWGELAALTQANVPTKSERNSQRLAELAERGEEPSRSDDIGLYEAGRYRGKQEGQNLRR